MNTFLYQTCFRYFSKSKKSFFPAREVSRSDLGPGSSFTEAFCLPLMIWKDRPKESLEQAGGSEDGDVPLGGDGLSGIRTAGDGSLGLLPVCSYQNPWKAS